METDREGKTPRDADREAGENRELEDTERTDDGIAFCVMHPSEEGGCEEGGCAEAETVRKRSEHVASVQEFLRATGGGEIEDQHGLMTDDVGHRNVFHFNSHDAESRQDAEDHG